MTMDRNWYMFAADMPACDPMLDCMLACGGPPEGPVGCIITPEPLPRFMPLQLPETLSVSDEYGNGVLGFDIDLGKFFTRATTISSQNIRAVKELGPMVTSIVGAATGTPALTQVGAAFGGVSIPGAGGGYGMSLTPEQQAAAAAAAAQMTPGFLGLSLTSWSMIGLAGIAVLTVALLI